MMKRCAKLLCLSVLGLGLLAPTVAWAQSRSNLQTFTPDRGTSRREREKAAQEARKADAARKAEAAKPSSSAPASGQPAPGAPARSGASNSRNNRRASGESAPAAPAAAEGPAYRMGGGLNDISIRLTPERKPDQLELTVTEGGLFTTDLMLANPANQNWNEIQLYLDYNPKYFEPMSINDSPIAPFFEEAPTAVVDRRLGKITYSAKMREPLAEFRDPLLFIKWKAKEPVLFNSINFGQGPDRTASELFMDGYSVLGDPSETGDGAIGIAVTVIPADPAEALMMQEEPRLYQGSNDRIGGVQLIITAPEKVVRVGDTVELDVVLDNMAYSMLDAVSLLIQYDPEVLEIIDDDWDNWITRDVNIHDGSFREDFPWDYHLGNAVYPSRGMIEYRVGSSTPNDYIGVRGTMARITAVAKKPTAGTAVRFLFSKRAGTRTTEAVYLGQDVLGSPSIKNDGVRGALFPVLPAN